MTEPVVFDSMADAVARVGAATVGLSTRRRSNASGVVWKPGLVVTTASALGAAERVSVMRPDGESAIGQVRGIDPATDLAAIEVATDGLVPVERRLDAALRAGDAVFAVGREASGLLHASFGRIGAAGGAWRTWRGGTVESLLRLDGGLYPGLAGAPVADAQGQVIGIASPVLARHHAVVLPVATVESIATALMAHGRIAQGYLGIAAMPVALGEGQSGLLISGLADDGPAAHAGLLVGDVITGVAGQPVPDLGALRERLSAASVGARIRLQLTRGGQPMELGIDVAERTPSRCH